MDRQLRDRWVGEESTFTYVLRNRESGAESRRFALCSEHHAGVVIASGVDLVPHVPFDEPQCVKCQNMPIPAC
jgi:hypothetical protein